MSRLSATGFTLIELMLSLAVLGVLAAVSLPVYASFQTRNDVDLAAQNVAELLRRGELYARGQQNDSQWTVKVQPSSAILFKGTDFATRDTAYDETVSAVGSITLSGLGQVVFSKFSGAPDTSGAIVVTSSSMSRTITINAKGMVDY